MKKTEIVEKGFYNNPNIEKIGNLADSLNIYLKEGKKQAMATKYYMIGFLALFSFMIIGGVLAVAFNSGGFGNFINNMWGGQEVNNRIICINGNNESMTFRSPDMAKKFMELFNNSKCNVIDIRING